MDELDYDEPSIFDVWWIALVHLCNAHPSTLCAMHQRTALLGFFVLLTGCEPPGTAPSSSPPADKRLLSPLRCRAIDDPETKTRTFEGNCGQTSMANLPAGWNAILVNQRSASAFRPRPMQELSPQPCSGVCPTYWDMPDPSYLASTTRIDPGPVSTSWLPPGTTWTDGNQTMSFSESAKVWQVIDWNDPSSSGTWISWSAPPYSEGATPRIISVQDSTGSQSPNPPATVMTLSKPSTIVGFELESWSFSAETFRVVFFSSTGQVAYVDVQTPAESSQCKGPSGVTCSPGTGWANGNGGARLVAINSPVPITSVSISQPPYGYGFAIANLRYGPVAGLTIDCAPNPVTRGSPVTCTAKDDNNQPVQASNWNFTSTDTQLEWTYTRTGVVSATWSGPMALGGVVRATASGGRSGSAQIDVANRMWDASKLAFPTVGQKGQGPAGIGLSARRLSDPPATFADLGYGMHWIELSPTYSSQFQPIAAGPNTGLTYAIGIPFDMRSEVAVNTAAMTVNSTWWGWHGVARTTTTVNGVTTTWCSRADVTNLLVPVEQHEGSRVYPTSHVQTAYDGYVTWLNYLMEPWVGTDAPTDEEFTLIKDSADAYALGWSNAITHSLIGNPIAPIPCYFRYTP